MKRFFTLATVLLLAAALAAPTLAGNGKSKGAVKTDVFETADISNVVGSAIFNTTADGRLLVTVQVRGIEADASLSASVWIAGVGTIGIGELTTNGQGNGNLHSEVDLPDGIANVNTRLSLKADAVPPDEYRTAKVDVPLK